jgi:hypothetical protein
MSAENKQANMEGKQEEILVGAIGGAFRVLVKIISGALTIFFLAAIVGWVRAHYYYAEFGLHWLANELSTTQLMSMSISPLTIELMSFLTIYFFISDKQFDITTKKIYIPFSIIFIVLLSLKFALKHFDYLNYENVVETIIGITYTFFSIILFSIFAITLQALRYKWNSILALMAGASIFGMLWATPQNLGTITGKIDAKIWKSKLPIAQIEGSNRKWRLLLVRNDLMYLVSRNEDEMKVHFKMVPSTLVSEVTTSLGIDFQ